VLPASIEFMEDEESPEENDRQEGGGESPSSSFFEETPAFPCKRAIKRLIHFPGMNSKDRFRFGHKSFGSSQWVISSGCGAS